MLQTTNRANQNTAILRCVWVPTHIGATAPLAAVWIETLQCIPSGKEKPTPVNTEGDSWLCAA
jgi:hypothetical protein